MVVATPETGTAMCHYPVYAGLAITGSLKNYQNAGTERTLEE
jgi:hypothetical protein